MHKRYKFIIYAIAIAVCLITLVLAITLTLKRRSNSPPRVSTDCGLVEGRDIKVIADNGKTIKVREFLNIPYAAPPVGDLRWKAPIGLKAHGSCWKSTLKYNKNITQCVQTSIPSNGTTATTIGVEDCLILNVWSPSNSKDNLLPVLLWIHGGGMVFGHSRTPGYYADGQLAASLDVVTVSINYRLGIFGFLSLKELWTNSTDGGKGNFAIMDQILALRWIKTNIKSFGGNPDDVTIFGESGGGTATYCLLSASLGVAKGLFHKVVASSGAPNIHTNVTEADTLYRPFIQMVNCSKENSSDVALCLRNVDVETIMQKNPMNAMSLRDYEWQFPFNEPRTQVPLQILDGHIIKHSPCEIPAVLKKSRGQKNGVKLDILMGNMAQEPLSMFRPKLNWSDWNALKQFMEPRVNSFRSDTNYTELLNLYKNRSSDKFTPSEITPYYVYSVITGDVILSCATTRLAYKLSNIDSLRVYSYIVSQPFSHQGSKAMYAEHGNDVIALFGFEAMKKQQPNFKPSDADLKLKKNLRDTLKRFIYSDSEFERKHRNRTMEFWNSTIHAWLGKYHREECKLLGENGFLKHSWGNVGVYND